MEITQEYLKECFDYDVETGQIYRKNDGRVYKMDMAVNGATVQVFLDENEWVV
jgi:predicted heme/steroid binding protein